VKTVKNKSYVIKLTIKTYNNLILIKTIKSYPTLKTILKSNSKKASFKARWKWNELDGNKQCPHQCLAG